MIRTAFAFAAALLVSAHAATPREVAGEVAAAIEENFYDEAKGKEIAAGLRAEADKGAYDALNDPKDLAPAITAWLKPFDTHFNVEWAGDGANAEPAAADPSIPKLPIPEVLARSNHGFRKVEFLPGNIAVIEMRGFDDTDFSAGDPARVAADGVLAAASSAAAVIFDLRQSMGGSPAMVGYLASAFLEKGRDDVYNSFASRRGARTEKPETPYANPRPDVPLFIVLSGRTSSAAESFPYTLQAARRATIVGEQSSGAGNPGGVFPLKSGYTVFISLGHTVNPITGTGWEKTGVTPDIAAPYGDALTAAYRAALEKVSANAASPTDKIEAAWALEQLNARNVAFAAADYTGAYKNAALTDEGGVLTYRRDRRPAAPLVALAPDLFGFAENPARRLRFVRENGKVTALEEFTATGEFLRLPRD